MKYEYTGEPVTVWPASGKVELNDKTSQKDLKKLYGMGVKDIVKVEEPKKTEEAD